MYQSLQELESSRGHARRHTISIVFFLKATYVDPNLHIRARAYEAQLEQTKGIRALVEDVGQKSSAKRTQDVKAQKRVLGCVGARPYVANIYFRSRAHDVAGRGHARGKLGNTFGQRTA